MKNGFHHLMRFLLIFHETFHHSFFLNMLRYIVRDAYQQLISFRSFYIRFSRLQYNLLLSLKMHHFTQCKISSHAHCRFIVPAIFLCLFK